MTTTLNPSFETADGDTVAWPENWTAYYNALVWGYRDFGAPYLAVESYAHGWSSNEDSLEGFGPSDIDHRLFGTDLDSYDDYEDQWGNDVVYDEWPADEDKLFDLAGDTVEDYEEEWPSRHAVIDTRRIPMTSLPDGGDPASVHTALNATKSTYTAHIGDDTVHDTADSTNTISSANATDLSTSVALVNEMWVDCWAHIDDSGLSWHRPYGVVEIYKPTMAEYPASTYDDCAVLAVVLMVKINTHVEWANNSGDGYVDEFDSFTPPITKYRSLLQDAFSGGHETYESDWKDNQDSLDEFDPGDIDYYGFQSSAGPVTVETFETKLAVIFPTSSSTAGTEVALSPALASQVECSGTFSGTAYVQTRNAGSATWVSRSEVTTVPVTVKLGTGYEAVRMYTETYSSGSPEALSHFLEE
jgi:hypothetical protein